MSPDGPHIIARCPECYGEVDASGRCPSCSEIAAALDRAAEHVRIRTARREQRRHPRSGIELSQPPGDRH